MTSVKAKNYDVNELPVTRGSLKKPELIITWDFRAAVCQPGIAYQQSEVACMLGIDTKPQ